MSDSRGPSRRAAGGTTKRVTFSGAGELIDKLQHTAEVENSSVSRVLDRLVRSGFAAEEREVEQDRLANRMEVALNRLERIPYGGAGEAFAVEAEQKLLAIALSGGEQSAWTVQALNPAVFATPAHARAWSFLRGDIEPSTGAAETIARLIEPQFPDVFGVKTDEYFKGLALAGSRMDGEVAICAFQVLDAYLHRKVTGVTEDEGRPLNYKAHALALRKFGQTGEWLGPNPPRKASIKTSNKKRAAG